MTTLAGTAKSGFGWGRHFYTLMSILLATIVVFGFSHTVPHDFAAPGMPWLLWLHAAIFGAWVLLFVTQPALIANRSIAAHRKLGWLGVALSCAMVALGSVAILLALWNDSLPPFYPPGLFITRGFVGLLLFALLVGAGIVHRRQAGWHKRLMLCAAIAVVVPGLERALPLPLFGSYWVFVVDGAVDLLVLAGPLFDVLTLGRVHPAYIRAGTAIVAGQLVVDLVAPTPVATLVVHAVGG